MPPLESSRLKGTLFKKDKQVAESQAPISYEWLRLQTIVNRDGGEIYTIKSLRREANKITLVQVGTPKTITLNLADFEENLKTEGGAWRVQDR